MALQNHRLGTGLPGLDTLLRGIIAGDNIVWRVDEIGDYLPFVRPFCEKANQLGRRLVYFRFAQHEALMGEESGAEIIELNPRDGFESFLGQAHAVIERTGRGAYYVFDAISSLSADWHSDQMIGNFFMLTCPYLFDLETVTYFALYRNEHSVYAVEPITETTQVFLDVYHHRGRLYVHPVKVQQRHSSTMHMLHVWEGNDFKPVTESRTNAEILTSSKASPLDKVQYQLGAWMRVVQRAEEQLRRIQAAECPPEEGRPIFLKLLRMAITQDERVLRLAEQYFDLETVVTICKRMVGSGLIGGKSVGMLLARAILKRSDPRWADLLEVHDSFYIASNVFYTFLVRNGCWWIRQRLRDPNRFLEDADRVRRRILTGTFPEYIKQQLSNMLDYFGQSPIIVRSSSLLEDNFGNAFAGKYDSVFCVNQGSRHRRLEDFIAAVKTIYASTMSERALRYRARRGILDRDEQMALLVQRVSGDMHGSNYYPHVAGVGYSFNPYAWSEDIDSQAGLLRLVFGLGTRAVDRADDDYTRLVALNAPTKRPEGESDANRQYVQRKVDVLDFEGNLLVTHDFLEVAGEGLHTPIELFASRDAKLEREMRQRGVRDFQSWTLTFDRLLSETPFAEDARKMLQALHEAYEYPVDVEFTANFQDDEQYTINVVQCRPFQVKGSTVLVEPPVDIAEKDLVLSSTGPVIGQSRIDVVDRFIYVAPSTYGHLPVKDRYAIARIIGQLVHAKEQERPETLMLLGPGRWGTTTPSLGVPVSFAEISNVSILCEIVAMREDLVPDVSLGTHFFGELVEMDMLYLALFPSQEGNSLNHAFFEQGPNKLNELLPSASLYSHVVYVIDTKDLPDAPVLRLHGDTLKQRAICYVDPEAAPTRRLPDAARPPSL